MLNKLLKFKDKYKNILNSSSHAIIIESEDMLTSKEVAKLYAMNLFCKNNICLTCENCLKVKNNNCLDVISFLNKTLMVEDVENIVETLNVVPVENEFKVYILDNFENASTRVQNKLLKSLEEPPKFVKFILLARNTKSILQTVLSRCEVFRLLPFSKEELLMMAGNSFDNNKTILSIENCMGSYGFMQEMLNNESFIKIYNLCLNMLINMTNSSKILEFSSQIIDNKDNFNMFLSLLINIFEDVVYINNNCEHLVKNVVNINKLKIIANEYSSLAIVKIMQELNSVKDKLKFNVNFNLIVDKMLLNMLEVKHKCKK